MGNAVANLTMFTKESSDDKEEIDLQLQMVQDYLYELEKKIAKQQTRVEELRRQKGLNEDKIKKSQDQARKLNIAAEAKENHDIGEREVKMRAI